MIPPLVQTACPLDGSVLPPRSVDVGVLALAELVAVGDGDPGGVGAEAAVVGEGGEAQGVVRPDVAGGKLDDPGALTVTMRSPMGTNTSLELALRLDRQYERFHCQHSQPPGVSMWTSSLCSGTNAWMHQPSLSDW